MPFKHILKTLVIIIIITNSLTDILLNCYFSTTANLHSKNTSKPLCEKVHSRYKVNSDLANKISLEWVKYQLILIILMFI